MWNNIEHPDLEEAMEVRQIYTLPENHEGPFDPLTYSYSWTQLFRYNLIDSFSLYQIIPFDLEFLYQTSLSSPDNADAALLYISGQKELTLKDMMGGSYARFCNPISGANFLISCISTSTIKGCEVFNTPDSKQGGTHSSWNKDCSSYLCIPLTCPITFLQLTIGNCLNQLICDPGGYIITHSLQTTRGPERQTMSAPASVLAIAPSAAPVAQAMEDKKPIGNSVWDKSEKRRQTLLSYIQTRARRKPFCLSCKGENGFFSNKVAPIADEWKVSKDSSKKPVYLEGRNSTARNKDVRRPRTHEYSVKCTLEPHKGSLKKVSR